MTVLLIMRMTMMFAADAMLLYILTILMMLTTKEK